MKALKMENGDIQFDKKVDGLDEFLQRWINSLLVYSNECYYNENLGLNVNIIDNINDSKYKLEHIKQKTLEWYSEELDDLYYELISEKERTIKAIFYFNHKKYKEIKKEIEL